MTEQGREPSIVASWADDPLAALAAAAAGVAVGIAVATFLRKETYRLSSGDEAPIRVRNGSLEVKLLRAVQNHANQVFKEIGTGAKRWRIKNAPPKGKPDYTVLALPADLATCPKGLVMTGKEVSVLYSTGDRVNFKIAGVNTLVDGHILEQDPNALERLTSSNPGDIARVEVDGKTLYIRNQPDPSLQVLVLDF